NAESQILKLQAQLVTAEANSRNFGQQLKSATGQRVALESQLTLSRLRLQQFEELAASGAGNRFDFEQAQADVRNLEGQLASILATEAQASEKLAARTATGEQDEVASVKAQIAAAEAQLADAQWQLSQTSYFAPANGTVVALNLRPGAMAVPL